MDPARAPLGLFLALPLFCPRPKSLLPRFFPLPRAGCAAIAAKALTPGGLLSFLTSLVLLIEPIQAHP